MTRRSAVNFHSQRGRMRRYGAATSSFLRAFRPPGDEPPRCARECFRSRGSSINNESEAVEMIGRSSDVDECIESRRARPQRTVSDWRG